MQDFLNTTHRTVAWFARNETDDALEIQPIFQRKPVWTNSQKSYLIDSILHGYPIPELYMQEAIDERGRETHRVVDGQQRVRACLDYVHGDFAIDTRQPNRSRWHGRRFDDLSAEEKRAFFGYRFVVRLLPPMSDTDIREIFTRLNRVVEALTQQELRHATYWGPFIQTAEELADDGYWGFHGIFSARAVRRMDDVEFVSELVIAMLHGHQNKKKTLDQWYQAYEGEFEDRNLVLEVSRKVFGELSQVVPDLNDFRWRKKTDFYSLFIVLAAAHHSLPLSSTGRTVAGDALRLFGTSVDFYLAARDVEARRVEIEALPPEVAEYARAVERAATDLSNRRARHIALASFLAQHLPDAFSRAQAETFSGISRATPDLPSADTTSVEDHATEDAE